MKYIIGSILIFMFSYGLRAQSDFKSLKNQPYLDNYYANPFDCDNIPDRLYSNLTSRICANIKLQESDSLFHCYNDSVRTEIMNWENEKLLTSYDSLQTNWRKYRDEQAKIIWESYEGCGGCHLRAIHYMTILRQLTDIRITELRLLLKIYREGEF